jgi:hypothetical protein
LRKKIAWDEKIEKMGVKEMFSIGKRRLISFFNINHDL